MSKCMKKHSLMFLLSVGVMLVSPLPAFAQKKSVINPSLKSTLQNVGWRGTPTNTEELFEANNPNNPKRTTNLKGAELISVMPNSYCSIGKFGRKSIIAQ